MKFSNHGFSQDFLKDVYAIMNGRPVEEKKKLDPVGKEDADIDNDGDTDKSDEYLHNRRKAIKKAMKEDTDIQELSKKTVGKYIKKATKSYADGAYQHGADPEHAQAGSETSAGDKSKTSHEMERRNKGIKTAVGKLTGTSKVKAGGKAKKWNKAPSHDMHRKTDYDGAHYGRYHEEFDIDEFVDSLSEAQLDEISAKLARKAAAASGAKHYEYSSSAYGPGADKESDRLEKKADKARAHVQKRQGDKGSDKVDRLTNKLVFGRSRMESVEEAKNAPSKENGGIAHQCATHVQHATYGEGRCIPGMHTIVETEEGEGFVTHYDVMFQGENGPVIVEDVSVNELKIIASESHKHSKRK